MDLTAKPAYGRILTTPTGRRLFVLTLEAEAARRRTCRACAEAINPTGTWEGLVMYCGPEFVPGLAEAQPAFLPLKVLNPYATCPRGKWEQINDDDLKKAIEVEPTFFHAMWDEMYRHRGWDARYVGSVGIRLPCGDCRQHFREHVAASPPPYGDDWGCFVWTFGLQNAVRARLKKDPHDLERTRAMFWPPDSRIPSHP